MLDNKIIKILENETNRIIESLEKKDIAQKNELDFYRDPQYSNLSIEEEELGKIIEKHELTDEQRELLVFVAKNKCEKLTYQGGDIYHTATYGEIYLHLFDYWKQKNPTKFKKAVNETIESGLKTRFRESNEHFTRLKSKRTNSIGFYEIDSREILSASNSTTPFRKYCDEVIISLLHIELLQITPGYKKRHVSVPMKYLS